MVAAILTIGTELTRGEVPDTNATWLAARLTAQGFQVREVVCVDDDVPRIAAALRRLAAAVDLVLVTGGLGPTPDDVTVEAAAAAADTVVARDATTLELLRRRLQAVGRTATPSDEKQADVPDGAEVLGNPAGAAPAFRLRVGAADCYFLPGVPAEVVRLYDEVLGRRIHLLATPDSYQIELHTYGLPEAAVGERLKGLEAAVPGVKVAYLLSAPEVHVKLLARAGDVAAARALAERAAGEARTRLGDAVFGDGDVTFAAAVGRALRARGYTLAAAESCTGGLVGAMLTAVPGSSDYLLFDAVTYSNAAKERVLGVPSEVLRGHGAVSPECVRAMAEGARRLMETDLAVSVSGVAGPGGGSAGKPVGLVYFALASARGTDVVEKRFAGDRAAVQRQAAYVALALVRDACRGPVAAPQTPVCG